MPSSLVKEFKLIGEYLKEIFSNVFARISLLLGTVSTAATFFPGIAQYPFIRRIGEFLILVSFFWANFSMYKKYAVPSFETEIIGDPFAGTRTSDNWRGINPSIRLKIRVVNNSDKSCSIIKIRVYSIGEWDWKNEQLLLDNPSHEEMSIPYSIPPHNTCQFTLLALLTEVYFDSKDIHFNELKLEIQDQIRKTYSHWLTTEKIFTNGAELNNKVIYAYRNRIPAFSS